MQLPHVPPPPELDPLLELDPPLLEPELDPELDPLLDPEPLLLLPPEELPLELPLPELEPVASDVPPSSPPKLFPELESPEPQAATRAKAQAMAVMGPSFMG